MSDAPAPKRKPVRRVFGRREFLRDGEVYQIEMRNDHLRIRRRYQRAGISIPFDRLPVAPDGRQMGLLK